MFNLLAKQVKNLFSSKKNGGKQVSKLTDWLHSVKLISLAAAIVILLGDAQFREHFKCQGVLGVNEKMITNYCYINGTTTLSNHGQQQHAPHIGMGVRTSEQDEVIGHNYVRSIWIMLLLLAILSVFPRIFWSALFKNETLMALLHLPGSEGSRLVRAAEQAQAYELLSNLPRKVDLRCLVKQDDAQRASEPTGSEKKESEETKNEKLMQIIEVVDKYNSIYDQTLDKYTNQLVYLMLTKSTTAYKLSSVRLAKRLSLFTLASSLCTLAQFAVPVAFLGSEYETYGWQYAVALESYLAALLNVRRPTSQVNSVDYDISARLFPSMTQCEYKQHGISGEEERASVMCSVAINEISAKIFFGIWWLVLLTCLFELWSLCVILPASLHRSLAGLALGKVYWPNRCNEANFIASFRHERSKLMQYKERLQRTKLVESKRTPRVDHKLKTKRTRNGFEQQNIALHPATDLSAKDIKRIEAEADLRPRSMYRDGEDVVMRENESCLFSCARTCIKSIAKLIGEIVCCMASRRSQYYQDELEIDADMYFLFYLIYLRLGSKTSTEEVIRMTSVALSNHLDYLATYCKRFEAGDTAAIDAHKADSSEEEKDKLNMDLLSQGDGTLTEVFVDE